MISRIHRLRRAAADLTHAFIVAVVDRLASPAAHHGRAPRELH